MVLLFIICIIIIIYFIKQRTIAFETEEETKYIYCEDFLGNEALNSIITKFNCCKFNCIQRISPGWAKCNFSESLEFCYDLRKRLLGRTKEDRAEKIFEMLKGMFVYQVITDK